MKLKKSGSLLSYAKEPKEPLYYTSVGSLWRIVTLGMIDEFIKNEEAIYNEQGFNDEYGWSELTTCFACEQVAVYKFDHHPFLMHACKQHYRKAVELWLMIPYNNKNNNKKSKRDII